ncbi:gas vesicle protein GvpG [Streptomyces sporangiiformans]|uniref:Gas vesicle protein n=1 Tax=Streptomyces sporangiiformans TaxID=2315329 RepID=A0A505D430_9ACTN|nr:gas vesicle protein GvpG [Streptomyces sporangiiformans]TPQ16982.1 gas vesicle protein [Streptomyces sporangiiformans]
MGLFTGVVTLPLAPVRGIMWIAEQIEKQAMRELADPAVIQQRLDEVASARESGEISEEEADQRESQLVSRLLAGGQTAGGVEV